MKVVATKGLLAFGVAGGATTGFGAGNPKSDALVALAAGAAFEEAVRSDNEGVGGACPALDCGVDTRSDRDVWADAAASSLAVGNGARRSASDGPATEDEGVVVAGAGAGAGGGEEMRSDRDGADGLAASACVPSDFPAIKSDNDGEEAAGGVDGTPEIRLESEFPALDARAGSLGDVERSAALVELGEESRSDKDGVLAGAGDWLAESSFLVSLFIPVSRSDKLGTGEAAGGASAAGVEVAAVTIGRSAVGSGFLKRSAREVGLGIGSATSLSASDGADGALDSIDGAVASSPNKLPKALPGIDDTEAESENGSAAPESKGLEAEIKSSRDGVD